MTTSSKSIQPIDIRRSRNFSEQLNITFAFVRQNFRKLGKCVLYMVGPAGAAAALLLNDGLVDGDSIAAPVLGILLYGFAWIMTVAVVNGYVFLYLDRGYDNFDISDVWEDVRWAFGKIVATGFGLGMLVVGAYVLLVITLTMSLAIGLLYGLCMLFVLIYFTVRLTPLFTARLYEDLTFSDAMSRSKELIQDNWWMTFAIVAVVTAIATVINIVLGAPAYIVEWGRGIDPYMFELTGTTMLVVTLFDSIGTFAGILLNTLIVLAGTLHYFNLVEKLEGVGVMEKIDQLGGEESGTLRDKDEGVLENP